MAKLIKCYRCSAVYSYGGWCSAVNLANETEPNRYRKISNIPDEHCPICRKPPQLEPTKYDMVM